MGVVKGLPDVKFEIMKVVRANQPPITAGMVVEQLGKEKEWKAQTILTPMLRLVERGFLHMEKNGKEHTYFPPISKEEYLKFEAGDFMERFHGNPFTSLVTAPCDDEKLKENGLNQLKEWLKEKRG